MISFLLWNFLTSVFAFGGGSSLLSYLYDIYVLKLHLVTPIEFSQISILSNILPGPVSVTFIGLVGFGMNKYFAWWMGIIVFALTSIIYSWFFYFKLNTTKIITNFSKYIIVIILVSLFSVVIKTLIYPIFMYEISNTMLVEIILMIVLNIYLLLKVKNQTLVVFINIFISIAMVIV